jgi:alpha-mannosidase
MSEHGGSDTEGKTLHLIGNAHIDPVWLWQWQEGFHEVLATFRSMLDRLSEYPDFVFTSSSAAFYEWVEAVDPGMFAEIKQRVVEGRWQIVGGWWIQPDCNIPCGESFVRQGLYGQRYFKDKLGVIAHAAYNPDSFGHNGMLPQILKKSGLDYYVFMRPGPHEKALPGRAFWWEADDGSRVLAGQVPISYVGSGPNLEPQIRRCAEEIKLPLTAGTCYYGVGNHGGGPTIESIAAIHRLQNDSSLPTLAFSSPAQFFAAVEATGADLPVVHDELQHHASGCYAAHSGIKQWNRRAENLLLAAEKWSTIAAAVSGQPYPGDLSRAWKDVLFCQFHDIMAGTSLEAAYDDARDLFGEAMTIAGRALNNATQSVAWNISIPPEEGMHPLIVFNPHAWPLHANVELEIARAVEQDALFNDGGQQIAVQTVQSQSTTRGRTRLSFVADVPAMGFRVYRLAPAPAKTVQSAITASDSALENGRWRLQLDAQTGFIAHLYDKQAQREVFAGPAAQPIVIDDHSDTWSHGVFQFDQVIGAFSAGSVRLVEHGPVKSVIRVSSAYGASRLMQDFTLYSDLDQIDARVTVDWHEQHKMLKLRFPVNLATGTATYEIPYGHIVRPTDGEEEPGQNWLDVSGASADGAMYGLSILNDGKYSFDVNGTAIGLTVLRSPIYAHHNPAVPQAEQDYSFIDQGIQHFAYTLLPHNGTWQDAETVRHAAELNQPPVILAATYHAQGKLPQSMSFVAAEPSNIVVSAIKRAEDGDGVIVRAYETAKLATQGTIHLLAWGRTIQADFGPCEIKTFHVPMDGAAAVTETNLLEWIE